MEPNHGSDTSKHSVMPPDATAHEALLTAKQRSNSSSSSCSSSSSSGSPFDDDVHLHPKPDGDAPSGHSPKVGSSPDTFSHSPEPSLMDMPANQSPPVQVMQRADESSPYRIPSTVFARSPSTPPVEWSVTSNESLFSIHMGNNSFSGDQIFLMGRSGELGKPGEYNNYLESKPMEPKNSLNVNPYPLSSISDSGQKSMDMDTGGIGVTEAAAETMKDVIRVTAEDQNKITNPPVETARHSSSYSRRSDESGTSIVSFAFPILTGADGGRTISAKVDSAHPLQTQEDKDQKEQQSQPQEEPKEKQEKHEKQQEQPSSPAPDSATPPPPTPAQSKWFPCFTCCSFCC